MFRTGVNIQLRKRPISNLRKHTNDLYHQKHIDKVPKSRLKPALNQHFNLLINTTFLVEILV